MLAKLLTALSLMGGPFVNKGLASPLSTRADACEVPNWSVQRVSVTYSDDTDTPGLVAFEITNSVTNQHESLKCDLLYNTLCRIEGTLLDKNLQIYFQVNLWVGLIRFNQTWTCQAAGTLVPSFVDASAEFEVECPEVITETMTCTGLVDTPLLVNGTIVTPIPDSPTADEDELLD